MLGTAWIDRPVDTQGCAPCFHVLLSAAWKRGHAQANDRHSSRVFAMPPEALPDDPKRLTRSRRRSAVGETRKLAAILVSDVVGYSRLAGADEDRTLARLRGLRSDLIDPAIAAHRGRIVKRTGDGSIIEFRSVVDAVNCAIEVQRAMVERNAGVAPDKRIEFRIGIHLGDVVEESDGDLMGDGVNIAARLEGIAKPGAICLSERRLSAGARDARSRGHRSRPNATQEHRRTDPGLLDRRRQPGRPAACGVRRRGKSASPRLSMVVLPFANIGGDPEQEHFVDGVTESLTTDLSRMRGCS